MISPTISRLVVLFFGTLHPAYASYKVVRTKKVGEYVEWMMYWIVYALFNCFEAFTDTFLSRISFYYELKVAVVLWLFLPGIKGSSTLYRNYILPTLARHEQKIDEQINKAKGRGIASSTKTVGSSVEGGNHQHQMATFSRSYGDIYTENSKVRRNEVDGIGKKRYWLRSSKTVEYRETEFSDDMNIEFNNKVPARVELQANTSLKKNKLEKARDNSKCFDTKRTEFDAKIRRKKLHKPQHDVTL
uniref:Receptor expression-enhancing protein n=1 Tax=Glossina brevipalpis TaxID=37001 RepID=A0A1A9X130_9MUSC